MLEAGCGRTTRLAAYRDRIDELTGVDLDADGGRENRTFDRSLLAQAGFEGVSVAYAATLHRHGKKLPPFDRVLLASERVVREAPRSTIVAWYREV